MRNGPKPRASKWAIACVDVAHDQADVVKLAEYRMRGRMSSMGPPSETA